MKIKNISIKWKILFAVAVGPLVISILLAWLRVRDIRSGAQNALVEKSQAIVFMAEAMRESMAKKIQSGLIPPFDQLPPDQVLDAVPVSTAINAAAINAETAGYEFRVPKLSPRNSKNTPDPVERAVLTEMTDAGITDKIIIESDRIRYFKPVRLSSECMYCHGEPKGAKDPTGGIKEGWRVGEIHGAFEIISSLDKANATVASAKISVVTLTAVCLSVILAIVWLLVKVNLLKPLETAKRMIGHIADGDLTQIFESDADDEIGTMVRQLDAMRISLRNLAKEIIDASGTVSQSSEVLGEISGELSSGAEDTSGRSHSVAVAAEEMSSNMISVAASMEQTSTNMGLMTGSIEEVNGTVDSISRDTKHARTVTSDAVEQAQAASVRVNMLGQAAREIEKITDAIKEISEQTNLLALNATIEAARAGDAGKGFVVVANEIKELANQTARATNEINEMVAKIQGSTIETVSEIEQVTKVIGNVNETVTGIAVAMNDQAVSTNDIVTSISQASAGINEVNLNVAQSSAVSGEIARDIAEVNQATIRISEYSQNVARSAEGLKNTARTLESTVARFKI